jgi:PAS domain S-box-containing protein
MALELSHLVNAHPALVWIALADGRAEILNQRWCAYTGLGVNQAMGHGWQAAVHPNDLALVLERWRSCLVSGQPGEVEARLRRHDGQYRRFHFSVSPIADDSGRIVKWYGINTDIEDRVRSDAAARQRQWAFAQIVDGLPAIVALFTPNGRIMFCNRRMLEYLDETMEQVRAKTSAYNFHPDDRDEVLALWAASVRSGKPFDREARLCRADGVYRWHRTRVFPLHNAAGDIELWYGHSTDIDDTKRAESKLAAEKQLLERVAQGVPLPAMLEELCRLVEALAPSCYVSVLLIDPIGRTFRAGAGPSLPQSYIGFLDGRTIDANEDPWSLAIASKAPIISAHVAKDPRWASSSWSQRMTEFGLGSCWSTPIVSGRQQVLGIFAIYRREPENPTADEQELIERFAYIAGITIERAQADAALKASEAELRQAHTHLSEAQRLSKTGSFTSDLLMDEHTWSDELYRICEFEVGSRTTFERVREIVHPEDMPSYEAALASGFDGSGFDFMFRIVGGRNTVKHLHAVAHRVEQISDRPMFTGAVQDVTARKVAEDALTRARAELAHVARAMTIGALTASIAHEVSQPLSGVITNSSTCLRMLATSPPNLDGVRAAVQRTLRDGNRAAEVVQRLRGLFARQQPATEPVDLNEASREVLTLSSSELQDHGVILRTDLDETLPSVSGDRVQLQQVILNLVLNAADAMKTVDDRRRDLLLETAREDASLVRLSVRDSGVGIDPQNLAKVFDAFYTTKSHGMGVGLSISRSIIESHNGRLWATTNDGPGATFSFSIPCEPGQPSLKREG